MKNIRYVPVGLMKEFLLEVAVLRPVFIWGPPGIGKSSVVNAFAKDLDMECVTLLGSQLAPEDVMGIPKIDNGVSKFYPPSLIYREKAFILFIDELNTAKQDVQKSFYSLILDHRVGEYKLPEGSVVIAAGNRQQDSAMANKLPSALINRMVHVGMNIPYRDWLDWAYVHAVHPWVTEFIAAHPKKLTTEIAPAEEVPFSSPRAWEFVSDGLKSLVKDEKNYNKFFVESLLFGALTQDHAEAFLVFLKRKNEQYDLNAIIKGDKPWPAALQERDILMDMAISFGRQIAKEMPETYSGSGTLNQKMQEFKSALRKLAQIDPDLAKQALVSDDVAIPDWFMLEVSKELPRLLSSKNGKKETT